MTKKEIYKLKPGTWLEIGWDDVPPEACLLLAKPEPGPGDVSLTLYHPSLGESNHHAVHTQIRAVLGELQVPVLNDATFGAYD